MIRYVHAQRARKLRKRGARVWFAEHHAGRNGAVRSLYAWQPPDPSYFKSDRIGYGGAP